MIHHSVITINFNNKDGLRKTIESVVNQTYKNFEYIIIDGGSTDGSLDVIREYAEKISYWISEPDNGIYNAMNKGILKSKGEYLQFLNSGDWLVDNNVFEKLFNEKLSCDLLYGNIIMVKPDGKFQINYGLKGKEITFHTLYNKTINHPSAFIRRGLFFEYGLYDEQLRIVSDWKFFLIVFGLNRSNIIYKNIEVTYFDTSGISSTQYKLAQSERNKVLSDLVPGPILADYNKNELDFINLSLIRKYSLLSILLKISITLMVTLSKILEKIRNYFYNN